MTPNNAKLDAEGRVSRPRARARRSRWSDRSWWTESCHRRAHNSRAGRKNPKPSEEVTLDELLVRPVHCFQPSRWAHCLLLFRNTQDVEIEQGPGDPVCNGI